MDSDYLRSIGIIGKVGSASVDSIEQPTGATPASAPADQTPYLPFGRSALPTPSAPSVGQANHGGIGKPNGAAAPAAAAGQGNDFLVPGRSPAKPAAFPAAIPNGATLATPMPQASPFPFTVVPKATPAPQLASRDSAGGAGQSLPRTVFPASPQFIPRVSIIPAELSIPHEVRAARERHKMVVMLHCAGMTVPDICKSTGYKTAAVGIILRSHNPELIQLRRDFGSKVAKAIEVTVYQKLQLLADESVDRLGDHMRDKEDKGNSRHAAVAILDRAGHSPVKKQITLGAHIPADELKVLIGQLSQLNEVSSRQDEWALTPVGG